MCQDKFLNFHNGLCVIFSLKPRIHPFSESFVLCRVAGMLESIIASWAEGSETPWTDGQKTYSSWYFPDDLQTKYPILA